MGIHERRRAGYSTDRWKRFLPNVTFSSGAVSFSTFASGPVPAWRAVHLVAADEVEPVDPVLDVTVLGVSTTSASDGNLVTIVRTGTFEESTWNWDVDLGPIVLGFDGVLTQTIPPGAQILQPLGYPISATRLLVRIDPPIIIG